MALHRIRLSAPWELYRLPAMATEPVALSPTCRLPFALRDISAHESVSDTDTIIFSRKFHRPSGLNESTRVFIGIELEGADTSRSSTTVFLNTQALSYSETRSTPDAAAEAISDLPQTQSRSRWTYTLRLDVSARLLTFNVLQLQFPAAASHTPLCLIAVNLLIEE